MKYSTRVAEVSDADILCEAEKFWAERPGHLVSQVSELRPEAYRQKIESLSKNPCGCFLVIQDKQNHLLGHGLLEPMGLKSISHIVRLTIVIHPGHEGKGLGVLLLEELIGWARSTKGVEKIELLVRATNHRAIALYRKLGFVEEGRHRNRIKISEGHYIDDVAMGLLIAPLPESSDQVKQTASLLKTFK